MAHKFKTPQGEEPPNEIQITDPERCRMHKLPLEPAYVALKVELGRAIVRLLHKMPGCRADILVGTQELVLWGPPRKISEAYQIVMTFLCNCLKKPVGFITTTNYERRRPQTTITTKYDDDEIQLRRLQ